MANYDETVDFVNGGDTGEANNASIQPVADAEKVWPATVNRSLENLRYRTETLRRKVEDLNYYADYDRSLILRSNATFTLTEPSPGEFVLSMLGDDLYVYPALSPGRRSGGRPYGGRVYVGSLPYSGTPLVDDLYLLASSQFTGQRGYYDTDDLSTANALTLGANRLRVDVIADATLPLNTVTFAVTQVPKVKITIRYGTNGGTTSLATLIAAINADTTSQGSYGVANILYAVTSAVSPGTVNPVPYTGGILQGAYDAEAHKVTPAQVAAFFAITDNRLYEGEGLAIGYPKGPVETGVPTPKGGRRQSLFDLPVDKIGGNIDNTTPTVSYNLFNTGRESEKIPGAVPIGKLVGSQFVFIDGTRLSVGATVTLGDSLSVLAALASTTFGSSGSSLVGYDGSGLWNPDAAATAFPSLPSGTVNAALDNIVGQLATESTNESGARRVGHESVAGTPTTGNLGITIPAGSLREVSLQVVNQPPTTTESGGLVHRVSDRGHALHGLKPISKNLGETTPENISAGGGRAFFTQFPVSTGAQSFAGRVQSTGFDAVQPLNFNFGGNNVLFDLEVIDTGSTLGQINIDASFLARATDVSNTLDTLFNAYDNAGAVSNYYIQAQLLGTSSSAVNGKWYWLTEVNATGVRLRELDGVTVPNFTGVTGGTLSLYQGLYVGNGPSGQRVKGFHAAPPGMPMADVATLQDGVIMRMWDPQYMPSPAGILLAKGAIFDPDGVLGVPRDTDNILDTGDKDLLDGVETGVVVDASASHHHGASYPGVVRAVLTGSYDFSSGLAALTAVNGDTFTGPLFVGRTVVGYYVSISFLVEVDAADAPTVPFNFTLESTPGATYSGSNVTKVARIRAYKGAAAATLASHEFQIFAFLPCNASGQVALKVLSPSANIQSSSTLDLQILASVVHD